MVDTELGDDIKFSHLNTQHGNVYCNYILFHVA